MNHASILALSATTNPRLIRADDTGLLYEIAAGADGSTAQAVGNAVVPEGFYYQPPQDFVDEATATYGGSGIKVVIGNGRTTLPAIKDFVSEIAIPSGVITIGTYALSDWVGLSSITIPDTVTSIGTYAFNNCYSLTSAVLPDGITVVPSAAFKNCYGLTSLTLPNSLTSIGNNAFDSCASLASVSFGDSLTSIGNGAFQSCDSLGPVILPASLTNIGSYAFAFCFAITVFAEGNAPSSVGSGAFYYVPGPLYYKAGTTGWTNPWNGIPTAVWTNWPVPTPN